MISKERITKLIDELEIFVSTNTVYHYILIFSSVWLVVYGIPFLMNEVLKDNGSNS